MQILTVHGRQLVVEVQRQRQMCSLFDYFFLLVVHPP